MFSHLRLKSNVLEENDRKLLVEAGIRLFRRKDVSVTKRVNRWLLGKENAEGVFEITDKNEYVIPYIINAFKKILANEPTDLENSTNPLKIIQNFFMEHSHLIDRTVNFIAVDLLRYIFNYNSGY